MKGLRASAVAERRDAARRERRCILFVGGFGCFLKENVW